MYTIFGSVQIQNITVNQWIKYPQRTKFVIIHELVHAKFKELQNPFYVVFRFLIPPKVALIYALRELRANTIAYEQLGCNVEVLEDYFTNFYNVNSNTKGNLAMGYVSGVTNIKLIKANPIWNKQAIEDAIIFFTSEFPSLRKISIQKIDQIKSAFIQQL
ncbi:hypothetical protein [Lysinibacillus xylanilyticus]|uniref:hypothetical protein n=1 Tax=Lysinibacillus xylanilyticus TaxID=582475 RepID=UPI003CFD1814